MKPMLLRDRILGVLAIAPMTDAELARCLCSTNRKVAEVRDKLERKNLVRPAGHGPRTGRFGSYPRRHELVA